VKIAIQRTVLVFCGGVAFVMPWTFHIEGLWTNFVVGFISGGIGGYAIRTAMLLGRENNEEN
jgi:hypothetical protein